MHKGNTQKGAVSKQTPWSHHRVGKYSLEEIALEFILWEDESAHSDGLRRDFIYEALERNIGDKAAGNAVEKFLHAHERLYQKIYGRQQGTTAKKDEATPERIRQLLNRNPNPKSKAA